VVASRKKEAGRTLRAFAIELVVYAILVTGYFFAVLHLLAGWLANLQRHNVHVYAAVSILLIIGQAVVLESVTTTLMRLLRGRSE
jgi:hypothetical protein